MRTTEVHSVVTKRRRPIIESASLNTSGGAAGNRTPDLVIANDALSQLSYSPSTFSHNVATGCKWVRLLVQEHFQTSK